MSSANDLKQKIIDGERLTRREADELKNIPLKELCASANELREYFCGNIFDICTIINGKSGRCSEDCKYCAQSAHYKTLIDEYPLLGTDEIVEQAAHNAENGVLRYSIVTSGRSLSSKEVVQVCESIRSIKEKVDIEVCVSFGLLDEDSFARIKEAGASRVHCNLETSRRFFDEVCTTHTYDEKIATLKAARNAGLSICSGGIMGLGETMDDRIEMAFTLKELGVRSVPINF